MRTLYLDTFSGISGDMFVGVLLDLGVEFSDLERELKALKLEGFHLHCARAQKSGIEGVKFDVHVGEHHDHDHGHTHEHDQDEHHHHEHEHEHSHAQHHHEHGHGHGHHHHEHEHHHGEHAHEHEHEEHQHGRNFSDIRALLARSTLSDWVKQKAVAVFHRVALAEGKVHGKSPEQVHFHEVGALDSIIDIVGGCIALELLGKPRVLASRVVDGTGWIDCAHGRFPIPAPATLEILSARGIALSQCDEPHELVTPTGAALLAEFVENFGPMTGLVPRKVGYGLGTRDNRTRPNVLRAVLCDEAGGAHDWEIDTVTVLQTNLDDINAEILGRVLKRAFAEGALDVFYTPIQMKKNRPGVLLSVLCAESEADRFAQLILTETTAFGVRRHTAERRKLRREFGTVETAYGPVAVKYGKLDGKVVQAAPEFESCKRVADANNLPVKTVYDAANRAIKT
jgi:pyridinium-3,5-bisthiocarboxylic acid mononucleotide nickel chelatase